MAHRPTWRIQRGNVLQEAATGKRYRAVSALLDEIFLQPLGSCDPMDFITVPIADLAKWTLVGPPRRKEVTRMAKHQTQQTTDRRGAPTPPKMTKQDWLKRDKTTVSITRGELEQLGKLIAAGRALLRNEPSISPKLRAAMTRLGINTSGL